MKVIILAGGQGTRLKEETEYKPKPMVEVGGRPILWHIMKTYSHYGFNDFILALGFKAHVIKDYFLNYEYYNNDFTITLGGEKEIEIQGSSNEAHWKVSLVDTGEDSMTGARIKRCQQYIQDDNFMLTYGDGLSNIHIEALVEFHVEHGRIGTLTGVNPPSRFGEIAIENNQVLKFIEKPRLEGTQGDINGGFMVFKKDFFEYLSSDTSCVLEREPLERLAHDRELMVYHHGDYWQCMDTYRDYLLLNQTWREGAPWKVWE